MKILKILIKNLASLEGESVIDFSAEPLASAGIFAITGPTGAGKSTILDALCLALYAKTPRYRAAESGVEIRDVQGSAISQNDIRGILRDGCAEGIAEVDFLGLDGQRYKASWSVRRARNKIDGALQADSIQLINITSGLVFPGKKRETLEEIERVIGLNFEQFTRSVLLAQGDFTAFLKAARDEKSSLLEKLTGTHIYSEISRKVFERHKEELLQQRDLNLRMEGIVTLSEDEIAAFAAERASLSALITAKQEQVVRLEQEIAWHINLSALQGSLTQAQSLLQQAEMRRTTAQERIAQFRLVLDVQELSPIQQNIDKARLQLANYEEELRVQELALSTLEEAKQKQEEELLLAKQKLEQVLVEQEQSALDLITARALDVQLQEREEQLQQAKQTLLETELALRDHVASLVQKETTLNEIEREVAVIEKWQLENTSRKTMAEQSVLIATQLKNAGVIVETLKQSEVRFTELSGNLAEAEAQHGLLKNQIIQQEEAFRQYQEQLLVLEKQVAENSFEQLEEQRSGLEIRWRALIDCQSRWLTLEKMAQERELLRSEVDAWARRLNDEDELLKGYRAKLSTLSIRKETAEGILSKARLAATADVKQLRNQLQDGVACPVCGSEHHPYEGEQKAFDGFLQEQQTLFNALVAEFNLSGRQVSSTEALVQRSREELQAKSDRLKEKEKDVKALQEAWDAHAFSVEISTVSGEKLSAHLGEQVHLVTTKLGDLKKQITVHESVRKERDFMQEKFARLQTSLNDLNMRLQKLISTRDRMKDEGLSVELAGQKAKQDLGVLREQLSQYFGPTAWFENWKKNPSDFIEKMLRFSTEWKNNLLRLEQIKLVQSKGRAELDSLHQQAQSLEQNRLKADTHFRGVGERLKEPTGKRKSLFDGRPVQEVERAQKELLDFANNMVNRMEKVLQETLASLAKGNVLVKRIDLDKSVLEVDIKKYIEFQLKWLLKYTNTKQVNLDLSQLEMLLRYDQEWIATESRFSEEIERAIQETHAIWKEREKDLAELQDKALSSRERMLVEELLEEAKRILQEQLNRQSEIDWRLRENEQNIVRVSSVLDAMKKQSEIVENWAKLNEVLGSADGKKFRQIAQEYTLDVLLGYANIHLQILSSRYVLERISGSLSLQVIDKDMGDEVRTVYSLSGGESFLVSLALALGLASLSSTKMQVESLFIDEGFGSLDPLTLNIAMDALERLHNQGRKVGVISHVQEMTERIPVQIRVNKQHSGRSLIAII